MQGGEACARTALSKVGGEMDDGFTAICVPKGDAGVVAEVFTSWLSANGYEFSLEDPEEARAFRYSDASLYADPSFGVVIFAGGVRSGAKFAKEASWLLGDVMYGNRFDEGWEEFGLWRAGETIRHIGAGPGIDIDEGRPLPFEKGTIEPMTRQEKEWWLEEAHPDAKLSEAPKFKTSLISLDFFEEFDVDLYEAEDSAALLFYRLDSGI